MVSSTFAVLHYAQWRSEGGASGHTPPDGAYQRGSVFEFWGGIWWLERRHKELL